MFSAAMIVIDWVEDASSKVFVRLAICVSKYFHGKYMNSDTINSKWSWIVLLDKLIMFTTNATKITKQLLQVQFVVYGLIDMFKHSNDLMYPQLYRGAIVVNKHKSHKLAGVVHDVLVPHCTWISLGNDCAMFQLKMISTWGSSGDGSFSDLARIPP